MDFYVNEEKIDLSIENEKNVGDILTNFQTLCENNNATIIGIIIDGKNIPADEIDEISKKLLVNTNKIELTTVALEDIQKGFSEIKKLCDDLSVKLEEVPVQLQNNLDAKVNQTVKDFTYMFDSFFRITTLSSLFPSFFEKLIIKDKPVNEFLINDLAPILKDFEAALINKDTVLIGDLCEYEILPTVNEIKDLVNLINTEA
ncbi:MAG: hypothetical protein GX220_03245 [Treponema sp.]|nr:hypothetical protein [Treponema sp.]